MTFSTPPTDVKFAIIGGTGLDRLYGLEPEGNVNPETPWGKPTAPILISKTANGNRVAFLARHGLNHEYSPSEVNYQANIAALHSLGVEAILSFCAIGSLRQYIAPGDFFLPDQLIDRTKGNRKDTFFGDGVVAHCSFGEPLHQGLRQILTRFHSVIESDDAAGSKQRRHRLHSNGTLITIEGPAFSTRAESELYRSWGADGVSMTAIPESKLAREAEIAYQSICMVTDYDSWRIVHPGENLTNEPGAQDTCVSVDKVMETMKSNSENAKRLLQACLPVIEKRLYSPIDETDDALNADLRGCTRTSLQTPISGLNPKTVKKLEYLFPKEYFE